MSAYYLNLIKPRTHNLYPRLCSKSYIIFIFVCLRRLNSKLEICYYFSIHLHTILSRFKVFSSGWLSHGG